ncbi:hypothetical protein HO173_000528 [Letharia columbiana]|uniref:Uncharacterized protein n=1 Tax=Letharia columbiana TaxID=112416 RepID=A0A8H6G783_9LECA|nr:uncharacterized protein HO173_000528 [Letharia columbiana]KAF6241816.1 hypothetical protein HO173_000528 [Letharia columbiana]
MRLRPNAPPPSSHQNPTSSRSVAFHLTYVPNPALARRLEPPSRPAFPSARKHARCSTATQLDRFPTSIDRHRCGCPAAVRAWGQLRLRLRVNCVGCGAEGSKEQRQPLEAAGNSDVSAPRNSPSVRPTTPAFAGVGSNRQYGRTGG